MKIFKLLILLTLQACILCAQAQVKPGIEVLRDMDFAPLKGKRVGLITNPTGVDSRLNSTADILAKAPGVKVTAFFAPEHGIRGDVEAGAGVKTYTDKTTGIPVYSLYGSTKKPTSQMLADVDVLVYDIQDIGCRSYTFISTMGNAMEAAAAHGKEFIVLDRPNPLGGNRIEGPGVEEECTSFVSQFDIPYIYGLTAGELAQLLKGEHLISGADGLRLSVVPMQGWSRDMLFGDTGLPWVPTSPNIPTAETCLYYPATGIAGELSFVSIGIGTPLPFRTFAAPWIDGVALAQRLNDRNIPGVRFRPISYKPSASLFSDRTVSGVEVYFIDPAAAQLTDVQFIVLDELHRMYPAHNALAATDKNRQRLRMFDLVTGQRAIRTAFARDYDFNAIAPLWHTDPAAFSAIRAPYLIY